MANTKPKAEDTNKRSPGKSKFVFPKREAPPVDNTYFDRLFSELQEQNKAPDGMLPLAEVPFPDQPPHANEIGNEDNRPVSDVKSDESLSPLDARSEVATDDTKVVQNKELITGRSSNRESIAKTRRAGPVTLMVKPVEGTSSTPIYQVRPEALCKPETSIYVDGLKLKFRLSKGEANVLRYLLGATHDQAKNDCYITIPKLAETVGLTARGCQLTLKSLQVRGFLLRIEEYDPTSKLGTRFQVNLIPL